MTKVSITKTFCSVEFNLEGHAGFAPLGFDIVCSAISMATQMTLIGLEEVAHAKVTYQGDPASGTMRIRVDNIMDDATWALTKTLELALNDLAQQYPQNIQIISC